ncbi:prolyl-tRNA synthetase associated domain-containing protein [Streptococcus halichoeri]|uniref:prolyl-tRNA synthetase associated domain-containing protein n=1 Tax=Streptococcus halichoeri TaxID=254785 RepID=UPI0013596000|nr:prolyl-tRNA synthetase associated domain-containing protein [Streptococcus halichoeri]
MDLVTPVFDQLQALGLPYQLIEHAPALTTEQADDFIAWLPGVRTKTLFLTNKKKTQFYLLIMDDRKQLDMEQFRELVGANRIRLASNASLEEKMALQPGLVSPFGLLFNQDHDIQVYIDAAIVSQECMTFHPNTNEKTIFIATPDLLTFLEKITYPAQIVTLA